MAAAAIALWHGLLAVRLDAAQAISLPDAFAVSGARGWDFAHARLIAYEDHARFTYVVAEVPREASAGGDAKPASGPLLRRFVCVKPAVIIMDDLLAGADPSERKLAVVHTIPGESASGTLRSEFVRKNSRVDVIVQSGELVCRLSLPPANEGAGTIAFETSSGQSLVANRPLASGVLPHGPEGMALLERWDSAYRQGGRAPWDTGRPSADLVKAVEEGALKPCRAAELGCGTGTNAVFLAQKGFDVAAIDIAPTALRQAQEKAEKAGAKIQCLLADVTAVPDVGPFDVVFDRGCYHGVRRQNAAGYVASLKKLTRAGSRVLILAGNAEEQRQGGPPRVSEAEIRQDFASDFTIEWLRRTHFDTATSGEKGALAWSILLRRNPAP